MPNADTAARQQLLDAWLVLTGQAAAPDGPVELPMLTGSMAPAIPVGARLRIRAGAPAEVRAGDVLVFRVGERLVAHRAVLVLGSGPRQVVLEKGDANTGANWRPLEAVCGRVCGFTAPDGTDGDDPAAPALASASLRRYLMDWCRGRTRRASPAKEES